MKNTLTLFLTIIFLSTLGCTKKSTYDPILYSKDACHHCKMMITDRRFGSEVITEKGKVFKFDSLECMAQHLQEKPDHGGGVYVTDSYEPEKMIEFQKAFYFHDPKIRSPMGKGIFASHDQETIKQKIGTSGEVLKWQEVLKLIGRDEQAKLFQ